MVLLGIVLFTDGIISKFVKEMGIKKTSYNFWGI